MTNTNSAKRPRRMAREPKREAAASPEKTGASATAEHEVEPAEPKRQSKIDTVIVLLNRTEGATLDELVAATGWLPHTTRAAMTGLKKKGHQITRAKVDGISRYAVAECAAL